MSSGSSSSSSSSQSVSPEPEVVPVTKSKKYKDKKKASEPSSGKNEGVDTHWDYQPPAESVLLQNTANVGEFDWDSLNENKNLELWLIRVPEGVKPKYLENAQLHIASSSKEKSGRIGALHRKHTTYDIWSVGEDGLDNEDDELPIGGEEIKALTCLLPRKTKKGRLYQAPRPITRHIVVSAQAVKATSDSASDPKASVTVYQNPPRQSYPKGLLKHQFMPYGSMVRVNANDPAPMDVDVEAEDVAGTQTQAEVADTSRKASVQAEGKMPKGKKRKGDAEPSTSPKISKKVKTAS